MGAGQKQSLRGGARPPLASPVYQYQMNDGTACSISNELLQMQLHLFSAMLPWPGGKKKPAFLSSSQALTCRHQMVAASHCFLYCYTSSRQAVTSNFYILWFDPNGL